MSGGFIRFSPHLSTSITIVSFQVKLFREWSQKWPEATKERLKEKLKELDNDIMEKIEEELKVVENGNGHATPEGDVAPEEVAAGPAEVEDNVPESLVTNNLPDEMLTA